MFFLNSGLFLRQSAPEKGLAELRICITYIIALELLEEEGHGITESHKYNKSWQFLDYDAVVMLELGLFDYFKTNVTLQCPVICQKDEKIHEVRRKISIHICQNCSDAMFPKYIFDHAFNFRLNRTMLD